ncbi:MAG TPA: HPr(Ser) kinase/phosphatase [Chlamydiales bacterium]|nr:HPr(Ser) kinase/phosphatase [Chlamydiales bacterium]
MYKVEQLYKKLKDPLTLKLVAGKNGLERPIKVPEAERPGLSLSGYMKGYQPKRLLVFGRVEMDFLRDLPAEERTKRFHALVTKETPAVIVAQRLKPPRELVSHCNTQTIPLFRTEMALIPLINKLSIQLSQEFAPTNTCHGTLVEVFGLGVLIQGNSSVGKSETALGLIERGHRLIADDIVKVSKREDGYLEGAGTDITKHIMEIRGIGIINVAHLYGAVCVRESNSIDIVVYLEAWDEEHSYERIGLEEKSCDILGCHVPFYVLPVKPGRDVVLLLETIALNHRLKQMGIHSAKEFSEQLHQKISHKKRKIKI